MIMNNTAEFHSMTSKIMLQKLPANLQKSTPTILYITGSLATTHAQVLPQDCEIGGGAPHNYTKISFQIILLIPSTSNCSCLQWGWRRKFLNIYVTTKLYVSDFGLLSAAAPYPPTIPDQVVCGARAGWAWCRSKRRFNGYNSSSTCSLSFGSITCNITSWSKTPVCLWAENGAETYIWA